VEELKKAGFSGAIVSPELEGRDVLSLPGTCPLPLGIVLNGFWPLCVSRTLTPELRPGQVLTSPKGEPLFIAKKGPNILLYPGWPIDLSQKQSELEQAGYRLFIHLHEKRPKGSQAPKRTSTFNWDLRLA
jgi:putative protease